MDNWTASDCRRATVTDLKLSGGPKLYMWALADPSKQGRKADSRLNGIDPKINTSVVPH